MKILDLKEINLLGPGCSLQNLNYSNRKKYFAFSNNSLLFLSKKNIVPDFFYFFDPNSVALLMSSLKSNENYINALSRKCCLIYHDFHESPDFYALHNLTTTRGESWFLNTFCNNMLDEFKSYFKNSFKIHSKVSRPNQNSRNVFIDIDFFNNFDFSYPFFLLHKRGINMDKFLCGVIPTLISYFPNLKSIYSLGFGDFEEPRIGHAPSADIRHYAEYTRSFNNTYKPVYELLKNKNIKLKFLNKDSYYNK